jgi:catechol 2,3-dioxygenase-like lactoylglutathione lyase family enzyme
MALHRLLQIEIGVRDPAQLADFYQEIGLSGAGSTWGGAEQPDQVVVVEAPYRQLRSIRVACEGEEDLSAAAKALDELGAKYTAGEGRLQLTDPINGWDISVEPAEVGDLAPHPERLVNRPGDRRRLDVRAEAITESEPRPPRRLGHFVLGTPDPIATTPLFKAIGFRVSDVIGGGIGTFLRCSPDHHSLLIAPGRAPYLNHYAFEHDDFDSLARAASLYLRSHDDDRHVSGPGRHQIGGNQFWYVLDPSGNTVEFFSDMDRIEDDEAWEVGTDWDPADSWSLWGDLVQPEVFFNPADMDEIVAGWEKAKR